MAEMDAVSGLCSTHSSKVVFMENLHRRSRSVCVARQAVSFPLCQYVGKCECIATTGAHRLAAAKIVESVLLAGGGNSFLT